jgi:hypothetical protein
LLQIRTEQNNAGGYKATLGYLHLASRPVEEQRPDQTRLLDS